MAFSSPGAAATCGPDAENSTGGRNVAAAATETCASAGGSPGIGYTASGGSLTVNINNDPVFTYGVNLKDNGTKENLTINDGLAGSFTASAISATNAHAVNLDAGLGGGNVSFTSLAGGTVTASGTGVNGINVTLGGLTGNGAGATIVTGAAVNQSGANGNGIYVQGGGGGGGKISITANANVTGSYHAILVNNTLDDIAIVAGSAANPVTITGGESQPGDTAINVFGGSIAITTFGTINGGVNGGGSSAVVNITGNVSTMAGNSAVGGGTSGGTGNATVTVSGGTISAVNASGRDAMAVIANTNGSGTALLTLGDGEIVHGGVAGAFAGSSAGLASLVTGSNITATSGADRLAFNTVGPYYGVGLLALSSQKTLSRITTSALATGSGNNITVLGDWVAGIAAVNNSSTFFGPDIGTTGLGGVQIATGSDNSIAATGSIAYGIAGQTMEAGRFTDFGDVTISVGARNSIVLNQSAANSTGFFPTLVGLYAVSGGNINISWAGSGGSITATGATTVANGN
ncbi:MAG TPA: hypothetical protein VG501_01755, partial [Rhizomicrobium sp.]|nr:hypothetical protein [Rhizomicrobium sp.]